MKNIILILTIIMLAVRPFMPLHEASFLGSYEAIAHILTGVLLGLYIVGKDKLYTYLFWVACAVEIICAGVGFLNK